MNSDKHMLSVSSVQCRAPAPSPAPTSAPASAPAPAPISKGTKVGEVILERKGLQGYVASHPSS